MSLCDNLVYVGMAFLTIGMLFGALWAKEAWGHYWNWDPKETWAAATWLGYLIYIHYRLALFGGVGAFGFLFSFATGVLDWRELSTLRTRI